MPVGNWTGVLQLEGVAGSWSLPNVTAGEGYSEGDVLELPFAPGRFFVDRSGSGGINLAWTLEDGTEALAQIRFGYLNGGQAYHLAIDWNLHQGLLRVFVNGVEQGDPLHGKQYGSLMPETWREPSITGGNLLFKDEVVARVNMNRIRLSPEPVDPGELRERVATLDLAPIKGEFRRTYTKPLDLQQLMVDCWYQTPFDGTESWVLESELVDESGKRVREPGIDQWVLEGDNIVTNRTANGLELRTTLPDDNRDGAMVFWHNRELPGDFLIEYTFTPRRSDSGLNILFFNSAATDGGSIFGLDQPARRGRFREYIVGSINNYHVSPWATDENRLRNSSNLRKNSGFRLLAIGDDRIGQHAGGKSHIIRVLKLGGLIQVEADGVLVMEYEDPGTVHGPVLTGGVAGIRFMAHTESVTMHHYKVFEVRK
ncbi:MAG: DUF1961 family protein [Oceanipulchritudo sp.]